MLFSYLDTNLKINVMKKVDKSYLKKKINKLNKKFIDLRIKMKKTRPGGES